MRRHRLLLAGLFILQAIPSSLSAQDLHEAVGSGDLERVASIVESGASLVDSVDDQGRTPLALAVVGGDLRMVELLLDLGADSEGPGVRGFSLVDLAFYLDCQRGSGLTRLLLDHGARLSPDAPWGLPVSRLFLTATFGSAEMAGLLLEAGADVNSLGSGDLTTLAAASRGGHRELVQALLEAGADPNLLDAEGRSPLSWAVERGHSSLVSVLLAHGADPRWVAGEGRGNLLHSAVLSGQIDIVTSLLDRGVPLDRKDDQGHAPLYYAGRYGHKSIAHLLLERGADPAELEEERFGPSPGLARAPENGEAFLWYLNNRGWAVKTATRFLVFDQEEFGVNRPAEPALANGFLTSGEIGDEDVLALYTCYHGNVGEPAYIHGMEDSLKSVVYLQNAGDAWRGSDRSVYLSPRDTLALGGARITTAGTMTQMATLAYLIEIDGLVLYYQGFAPDDIDYYLAELDFLATVTDHVDLAFLPIPESDPGSEVSGFKAFLHRFQPGTVALLDPSRREELFPGVAEQIRSWGLDTKVFVPKNPGDVFHLGG